MPSLFQTSSGMFSDRAGRGRPGATEKRFLINNLLRIWVKGDPKTIDPSLTITRDVSKIGHWDNGNIELSISDLSRLPTAEPFIRQSIENTNRM